MALASEGVLLMRAGFASARGTASQWIDRCYASLIWSRV
jgi:hypothetical protein